MNTTHSGPLLSVSKSILKTEASYWGWKNKISAARAEVTSWTCTGTKNVMILPPAAVGREKLKVDFCIGISSPCDVIWGNIDDRSRNAKTGVNIYRSL